MVEQKDDHNAGGMAVFLFGMVASVVFFIYIIFVHHHPSPDVTRNLPQVAGASTEAPAAK